MQRIEGGRLETAAGWFPLGPRISLSAIIGRLFLALLKPLQGEKLVIFMAIMDASNPIIELESKLSKVPKAFITQTFGIIFLTYI